MAAAFALQNVYIQLDIVARRTKPTRRVREFIQGPQEKVKGYFELFLT